MRYWMIVAAAVWCLGGHACAQSMTPPPEDMSVMSTSDDDGVPAPGLRDTAAGPLRVQARMNGQWSGTEGAQIVVQVKLTNPTRRPVVLDEVRADFKRGARPTDPTVFTDRRRRVTVGAGHAQSVWLGFDNPQRLGRVSVDLALSLRDAAGRPLMQRAFLKGNEELRFYERLDRSFNGLTPPPDSLGGYPITTGPLYPWPSPYDSLMQPPNRGIINIGL